MQQKVIIVKNDGSNVKFIIEIKRCQKQHI